MRQDDEVINLEQKGKAPQAAGQEGSPHWERSPRAWILDPQPPRAWEVSLMFKLPGAVVFLLE